MHEFNTALVTRMLAEKAAQIPQIGAHGVCFANPGVKAKFPCCVIQPPLQRSTYHGAALELSVTVEVWASKQLDTLELFDQVRQEFREYNLKLTNNTPLYQDMITSKWRFGGYFSCRYNAILNTFEEN